MKRIISVLLALAICFAPSFAAAAEGNDIVTDLEDGEPISGTRTVSFITSDKGGCTVKLDGKELEIYDNSYLPFCVTVRSVDYTNSVFKSGETVLGTVAATADEQRFTLTREIFESGVFDITFVPSVGSALLDTSKVYGTYNIDDVELVNAAVTLPSGERITPKTVTRHLPVSGGSGTRDRDSEYDQRSVSVGDGWSAATGLGGTLPETPISVTYHFDLSQSESFKAFVSGGSLRFTIDTTAYEDGEHTLAFSSLSGEKQIKVIFDNTPPVINAPFATGALFSRTDKITATCDDAGAEIEMTIDGKAYRGQEIGRFLSKTSKTHVLMIKATDRCGNVSYRAAEFRVETEGDSFAFYEVERKNVLVTLGENARFIPADKAGTERDGEVFRVDTCGGDKLIIEYRGESSENNMIRLSALDISSGEYIPLGLYNSGETAYIEYEVAENTVKDGIVTFKAEEYVYSSPSDTLIWISDTQYYTRFEDILCEYESDIDYYIDLYQKGEAGFFIHTGDVADEYSPVSSVREQMKRASDMQAKLDILGIPYGIVDGNHDVGQSIADAQYFTEVFGASRFDPSPWFYGNLYNNTHHYDLVTLGGNDFLFLWLGYYVEADPDVIAWADMVLDKYPDRNAIILTHSYLDIDNDWVLDPLNPEAYTHSRAPEIWANHVVPHKNVVAVFCGHTPGVGRNLRKVDETRSVWEVLADYQFVNVSGPCHVENGCDLDGEGYIRIVSFKDGKMIQQTYSPFLDDYDYFEQSKDEFTVDLKLAPSSRTFATSVFNAYTAGEALSGSGYTNYEPGCDTFFIAAPTQAEAAEAVIEKEPYVPDTETGLPAEESAPDTVSERQSADETSEETPSGSSGGVLVPVVIAAALITCAAVTVVIKKKKH